MSLPVRSALLFAAALALVGCGGPQTRKTEPNLVLDPASIEYGERPVYNDEPKPVTFENTGLSPLHLSSVRIEGDGFLLPDGFSLPALEGGATIDVPVTFAPREMKAYAATLVVESDDPDEPVQKVALTGTGSTAAQAVIDPPVLDFGRVGESRSAVKRVRITSVGTADLVVKSISFGPDNPPAYGFLGSTNVRDPIRKHVEGQDDAFVEITVKFAPTQDTTKTDGTLVIQTTDPDHLTVTIPLKASVNKQPIAVPGNDRAVAPGTHIQLDGSASSDPDGDVPLAFKWTLAQKPQGSAAALAGETTATPAFDTDQPGAYAVDLVVTDSAGLSSKTVRVTITAVTADKLLIELVWDHPVADLDLHVRPMGQALDGAMDCTAFNPHPDWGVQGDPNDDPSHLGDRLAGFGPEYVVYEQPADGQYVVTAKYVSAQGSSQPQLTATVRVYLFGVVQRELSVQLDHPGQVWNAAVVEWPTGKVTVPPAGLP